MAIEKGLYGMPEGIDEELMGEMGKRCPLTLWLVLTW
jgi:hypothetical protein